MLRWDAAPAENLWLQQAPSSDFNSFTQRPVSGRGQLTLTGLPDGDYFYRLFDGHRAITPPTGVTVAHHNLSHAFAFFAVGLALFIGLIVTILVGQARARKTHLH